MSITLLFDLDDTLLDTNLDVFIPAYFKSLSDYLEPQVPPGLIPHALLKSWDGMSANADPTRTLFDVFEALFFQQINQTKTDLVELFNTYYKEQFPKLARLTKPIPAAKTLVDWALSIGYRVAIATDPVMPRTATHERIRWAGLDPDRIELISTMEDFHFSKSSPAYFAEVLGRLGWPEGPVLVIGNDVQRDLVQAYLLGVKIYHVVNDSASSPGFEVGRGRLADLRKWLESTDLSTLEPSFQSPEAILAILRSTPAVLESFTSNFNSTNWTHKQDNDDWAMNELVNHLFDTELEVHGVQIDLMLEKDDAFLPRPESNVWVKERDYIHTNGAESLRKFADARINNLNKLTEINTDIWARKVRHAIFGRTSFLEAWSFMASHDRMHVQQASKALTNILRNRV